MERNNKYMNGGAPFVLKSSASTSVVICIHGFCVTTYEIRPIAEYLFSRGFNVVAPLIPGHGLVPIEDGMKKLSEMAYTDWIEGIRDEVLKQKENFKKVFIYGQSMGGALALAIGEQGLVDGIAVTGAAIRLKKIAHFAAPLLGKMNKYFKRESNDNIGYPARPSRAINQMIKLANQVTRDLHKIRAPILVIHSKNDDTIPSSVPEIIKKNARNSIVKIEWFNESGHTYPLDKSAPDIMKSIGDFFKAIIDD
ncbi:MAG: alpha/beta hydrolase [Promethearchaeota archaeon]